MLELVRWSFTLPLIAIVVGVAFQGTAGAFRSIRERAGRRRSEDQLAEKFAHHAHAVRSRLRAGTHAH